jgi:ionotropic glutamate receptor
MKSAEFELGKLKVFDGRSLLLNKLLYTNFTVLSGKIQFNQNQNILNGGYNVINNTHIVIDQIILFFKW